MPRLSQISGPLYERMFEFGPIVQWPQKGIVLEDKYLGFNVARPTDRPKTVGTMVIRTLSDDEGLEISYVPETELHGICLSNRTFETEPFAMLTLIDKSSGSINLFNAAGALVEHDLSPVQEDTLFVAMSIAVLDRISRDDAKL